jgi:mutator protein MutT
MNGTPQPASSPRPAETTRIAIAVVERDGCFLVGVRPDGGPLAGYWEFPGGKVGEGETPAAAAARECLEETGLAVTLGPLLCSTVHEYGHGRLELHFFAAVVQEPCAAPSTPFRWVARQALATLRFPPANADVLSRLLAASAAGNEGRAGLSPTCG